MVRRREFDVPRKNKSASDVGILINMKDQLMQNKILSYSHAELKYPFRLCYSLSGITVNLKK